VTDDEDDPGDDPTDRGMPPEGAASDLDPRVQETLRRVFGVAGVVSAKVWSMPDRMYVGVRVAFGYGLDRVLEDVRRETMDLAEPGEQWEFGQLDGD